MAIDDEAELDRVPCLFSRSRKKDVNQALETLLASTPEKGTGPSAMELFSAPGVTAMAASRGCKACGAFDKLTGWNADDPQAVAHMWDWIHQEDPLCIGMSPLCTFPAALVRLTPEWKRANHELFGLV